MRAAQWAERIGINAARVLLGLALVVSGFVKTVDPIGTQYKLQEYGHALGVTQWLPDGLTLSAAVVLSGGEFVLGVLLLLAIRRRVVSRLTLLFMLFMTAVTVWVALGAPVKDCGCFGDWLPLSPMETLGKNVVLLMAAALVAWKPLTMVRFVSRTNQWIAINYTLLFALLTALHCLYHLPLFDFRPYRVGVNIQKGMEIPPGAKQPEFRTTFILKKGGVEREFTLENYPDSTWTFVDSRTVQVSPGYVPPIHDFSIQTNEGDDITEQVLSHRGYTFLLIAPHLEQANDSYFGTIDQIYEYAQAHHIPFYCLTASVEEGQRHWQDITGAEYPICLTDETTLKTIIRSNPGLVLLKQGTIVRKWGHNDLPILTDTTPPLEQIAEGQPPKHGDAWTLAQVLLWFVLPLSLLTLADRTWHWSRRLRGQLQQQKQKIVDMEEKTINRITHKDKQQQS